MKWGRRKSSSPSSSSSSSSKPSFISHVSPLSWLSKFKNMRINSHPLSATMKQKGTTNQNSLSVISPPQCKSCENGGRFYGGDDDDEAFWRLSFGEESKEDKKSKDILSNAEKYERRREGTSKLKENNKRELGDERNSPNGMKMDEYNNREKELDKLRRRFERKSQRVLQERVLRLEREAENATPTPIWTPRNHSFQKTEEFKANTEKKRQSILVSREIQRRKPKQSSKVRIYSPRMSSKAEICKIKALEDMRKAKLKMKKAKEGLDDSFAVVKCSLDPQKDFRDSMVEMIREKQIGQAEEMEELLASYLTLNSEEYHDLIIKVFKQVWFDMNIVWGFS